MLENYYFNPQTYIPGIYVWILNNIHFPLPANTNDEEVSHQFLDDQPKNPNIFEEIDKIVENSRKVFLLFGILGEEFFDDQNNYTPYFKDIEDNAVLNYLLVYLISLLADNGGKPQPAYGNFNAYTKFVFGRFAGFLENSSTS